VAEAALVSVIVVNYRTEGYLRECLRSVREQSYPRIELILINNGSPGFDREAFARFSPEILIDNHRNQGFARANNQGIRAAQGELVLLLNADARIPPDFVRLAAAEFARDRCIGSVVPRLVRWQAPQIVESTGHLLRTDFTVAHRDHGVPAELATGEPGFVFGGSAACIVYRREMLEAVSFRGEYFDESFFAYYEDVDLDLRAQLAGYTAWYSPELVAEHVGHGSGGRNRRWLRLVAEKNRYLMLTKCLTSRDLVPVLPAVAGYEAFHFLRTLLQPYLFLAVFSYLRCLPLTLARRRAVLRSRTLKPGQLRSLQTPRTLRGSQAAWRASRREEARYPVALTVVVVNYNGLTDTRQCLDSLRAQTFTGFETIVVDNGSRNREWLTLETEYPEANVVCAGANTGFAGGVNLGYLAARGKYVVLLNNDAVPEPGFLAELVAAMEQSGADAGCGVLLEPGTEPTNDSLNLLGRTIPGVFGAEALTFYPSGAAAILRRASLQALGALPFDAQYFLYHEDVSLGFRIRLAGGKIIKIHGARATHRGGATTRKLPLAEVRYFQTRNRILNRVLFYETATLLKALPLTVGESIYRHLRGLISGADLSVALRVDWFFLSNCISIMQQRRQQGRLRHSRPLACNAGTPIRDSAFLPLLSGRMNGQAGWADALSLAWLRLVRLPVRETTSPKH